MRKQILDHGYIELVETWGSEERIIEAARMSTNKGFMGWGPLHEDNCSIKTDYDIAGDTDYASSFPAPCSCKTKPGDEKLLRYLYMNNHATPFEMAGMIIEIKAPIFVFREWHRHRTQSYNEMSARYTPIPDENYIPSVERLIINQIENQKNKQAGSVTGTLHLSPDGAEHWRDLIAANYKASQLIYEAGLMAGIPKELARLCLPVGRYSKMRASANLRNWLAFLTLRMAENAQWEIRQYANAVGDLIKENFPRTWELFSEKNNAK